MVLQYFLINMARYLPKIRHISANALHFHGKRCHNPSFTKQRTVVRGHQSVAHVMGEVSHMVGEKWCTWWEKSGAHGGRKVVHMVGEKWRTGWEKSGAHGGRKVVHMVGEKWQTWWEKSGAHGGRKVAHMLGKKWHTWWKKSGTHSGRKVVNMVGEKWRTWCRVYCIFLNVYCTQLNVLTLANTHYSVFANLFFHGLHFMEPEH